MNISGNLMAPVPMDARSADSRGDVATADSSQDSPADTTTPDSPEDSPTDTGPSTFDVIDDFPIGNLIIRPLDSGSD
jgi:hypothetical protein